MKRVAVIIQARMGSTRLPRKVLADIEGKPMLWHHVNRLTHSKFSPEIIIATTSMKEDQEIIEFCKNANIKFFVGSNEDVLDRYYQSALKYNVNVIVRITGDCPLIDPEVFDKVLKTFLNGNYDYVSNVDPPTYPHGLDVEVFSFEALEKSWKEARLASEREHVTLYIENNPELFKSKNISNFQDYSALRWTVDEKEDLQFVREIYKILYPKKEVFLMHEVLEVLQNKPELIKINNKYQRNEGLMKSLKNDKIVK